MFFIFIKARQGGRQAREQEVKSCARWVLFSLPSAQAFFFQPMTSPEPLVGYKLSRVALGTRMGRRRQSRRRDS